MSAVEIRRRIGERTLSPVEVVASCLERIADSDPALGAFIEVAAEQAMATARESAAAVQSGERLGPLHGVPVALKDELWTAGTRSTGGSMLFARFVPWRDATVVDRLRRAGAIVIGKTNMPEFAGWPRSKTRLAGESVNPWDHTRISGASSGGSAAAVAAGMVPIAIGSDGGGSTRIPSALCGTVGLFPTPGRVSSYGSFSYSTASSLGPIARDVDDVALVQQVIAGPDPRDASARTDAPPNVLTGLARDVSGRRIAWSPDFGRIPVDSRILDAGRAAMDALTSRGAYVDEIDSRIEHPWGDGAILAELQAAVAAGHWQLDDDPLVPDTTDEQRWMWDVFGTKQPLTENPRFVALCRQHLDLLTPASRLRYESIADIVAPAAQPTVEDLRSSMDAVLATHDVLCSPTMATVAPVAPDGWATPYPDPYMGTNFTFIANATGCPAASVPVGLVDGLPVGLQIIGRPGDEATVLHLCHAVHSLSGAAVGRPPH